MSYITPSYVSEYDDPLGNVRAFLESTAHDATLGVIGFEPSPALQAWRENHKVASVASSVVGFALPFSAFRAVGVVGRAGAAAAKAYKKTQLPFASSKAIVDKAVPIIAQDALFEGTRNIIALGLGNKNVGDALFDTAVNTTIGAGLGFGIARLGATQGKVGQGFDKITQAFIGDVSTPPQLRLQRLPVLLQQGKIDRQTYDEAERILVNSIVREEKATVKKYDGIRVANYVQKQDNSSEINTAFVGSMSFRDLVKKSAGASDIEKEQTARTALGFNKEQIANIGELRFFSFDNKKPTHKKATFLSAGEEYFRKLFKGKGLMGFSGSKWLDEGYLFKLTDGGYVALKLVQKDRWNFKGQINPETGLKYKEDKLIKGKGEVWTMFKTNQPALFFPRQVQAMQSAIELNYWKDAYQDPLEGINIPLVKAIKDAGIGMRVFNEVKNKKGSLANAWKRLDPTVKKWLGDSPQLADRWAREWLYPSVHRFNNNIVLQQLHLYAITANRYAQATARSIVYGVKPLVPDKDGVYNAYNNLFDTDTAKNLGGLAKMIRDVDKSKKWEQLEELLHRRITSRQADDLLEEGIITADMHQLMKVLQKTDVELTNGVNQMFKKVGLGKFRTQNNYRLATNRRVDPYLMKIIVSKNGAPARSFVISDITPKDVKTRGDAIQRSLKSEKGFAQEGYTIGVSTPYEKSQGSFSPFEGIMQDLDLIQKNSDGVLADKALKAADLANEKYDLALRQKKFKGIGGRSRLTSESFIEHTFDSVRELTSMQAYVAFNLKSLEIQEALRATDGALFRTFDTSVKAQFRQQPYSEPSRYGNVFGAASDFVANNFGTHATRKAISGLNSFLHFTAFAFNGNYVMMQVGTWMNTFMPFLQNLQNAPVGRAAQYFTAAGVLERFEKGDVTGVFAGFDPIRLQWQTHKEMLKPSPQTLRLYQKAIERGTFEAQIFREGTDSVRLKSDLETTLESLRKEGNIMKVFAEAPLALQKGSEYYQRVLGFTAMVKILQDVDASTIARGVKRKYALDDEAMFTTAAQAVSFTMFEYTAADRPKIFSGVLGSFLGTFKTWIFNDTVNQMNFIRSGIKFNDWKGILYHSAMLGGYRWRTSSAIMGCWKRIYKVHL